MKTIIFTILLFILSHTLVEAEIIVVVNQKNKVKALDAVELQDIYMGRKHAFSDGSMALPIDQADMRADFYLKLTNRPIEQVNAYWARIMFSGQASPPRILPDDSSVIRIVKDNPGAIGYISKDSSNKDVRTLLILK